MMKEILRTSSLRTGYALVHRMFETECEIPMDLPFLFQGELTTKPLLNHYMKEFSPVLLAAIH